MEIFETEQELIKAIIEFNNDANVQRLQNFYNSSTFPDILGVGRRELSHSAFLAWLFDMSANHGLGAAPVLQLLELFVACFRQQNKVGLDSVLMNAILSRNITIHDKSIETEYNVKTSAAKGRADIVMDIGVGVPDTKISKLRIVIENKVYSSEHDKQTCTYFEYYEKEKPQGEYRLYIYLTSLLHEKDAECESFVHITYQDLLDNVFEPILRLPNLSERTQFILTEYINCLSIPVEEFTNKKNIKRTTIMAISENERNLLNAFWKKHEKLIMAVHSAMASDPNLDEEEQEIHKKLAQYNNKDYSKYSVNGEGSYGKGPTVKQVVKCYMEKHPDASIEELEEKVFPYDLQGGGLGVVQSYIKEDKKRSEYYDDLRHPQTNEIVYVCKRWRGQGGNFDKFIKYVNENIPDIKIAQI